MNRRFSKVAPVLALLLVALSLPAYAGTDGAVSGVVRDGKGTPQIGTLVQLLRPDLSVIAQTFTDDHGRYELARVLPGVYGLKATGSLFLPTLRENLHITASSKVVVNLTLSTLYEAFRWLPAQPRQADEPQDDWTWTLRLSANRPLLRMLEDGPLVVVTEAEGQNPALKARVTIRGGESSFGDGGVHHGFEMRRSNDDSRQLILRADLSQSEDPALNTVVGYEQQLAPGRILRTVGAFVDRPDIAGGPDTQGLQAMVLRTAEAITLTEAVDGEIGNEIEAVHLASTEVANHPFATLRVHTGDTTFSYRVATSPGMQQADAIDRASTLPPAIAERDGKLMLEHGLHQELAYSHAAGNLRVRIAAFHDHIAHPVVNGGGIISAADWKSGDLLYDSSTGALKVAGEDYSGDGLLAELKEMLPDDTWISVSAATGDALTMEAQPIPLTLENGLLSLRPRRTEMVSVAYGGKLQHAGTQWQASYRWQPSGTLTAVDSFDTNLHDPYLSFYLRQPIHCRGILPDGFEALIDVRNLLAQGYRPFVTSDGSVLYFAEAPRAVEGGLSFSF
ncbi:MAG TPA: carboxypeptidase-like regulatory domain-containing protein [Silvibacterium sp.]|nr:carboxypeptidase-like regulatory domain-containing protein [Silvibacterium sp.]